jgi:hypothetical protein
MKKACILLLSVTVLAFSANAQRSSGAKKSSTTKSRSSSKSSSSGEAWDESTSVIQGGIGLVSGLGLPINVTYEKAISEKIGVGGSLGFGRKSYSSLGYNDYTVSSLLLLGRGAYHFYTTENIDAYGALLLGYNVASVSYPSGYLGTKATYGGVAYGLRGGGRYYFNEKVAGFAEVGFGISTLDIGVAYKLN